MNKRASQPIGGRISLAHSGASYMQQTTPVSPRPQSTVLRKQEAINAVDRRSLVCSVDQWAEPCTIEASQAAGGAHPQITITILGEGLNTVFRKTISRTPDGSCEVRGLARCRQWRSKQNQQYSGKPGQRANRMDAILNAWHAPCHGAEWTVANHLMNRPFSKYTREQSHPPRRLSLPWNSTLRSEERRV